MPLKIILANPRGFCAGVNMAIDVVDEILKVKGAPLYVYHEIVHNRHVVDGFKARGVTFVDDVTEVPAGATIVYSAHGISPAVKTAARDRGLKEIDATCPLVTKVHMEVIRYARQGYTIVFIGHHNHDEAVGTVGEAPENIVVVESVEDVEKLKVKDPEKLAFVTQTTLSVSDAEKIIGALRKRFPQIKSPPKDDICYATTNRQNAVSQYAPDAQIVLVIGSKNSSNSQRLVDRAKEAGKPAYLIDDQSELKPEWFNGVNAVLITAGASAPEHLVNDLIDRLRRDYGGVVEVRTLVDEDVSFAPPASLKSLVVLN
jgi:4-hydroxy-3-methylbut-2-enyl diphosphate reductase